jgi:hypothetical protein
MYVRIENVYKEGKNLEIIEMYQYISQIEACPSARGIFPLIIAIILQLTCF